MNDFWIELKETLQDDSIYSEIKKSLIDPSIKETSKNLLLTHLEAEYIQGLESIATTISPKLNAYMGNNRTGKSSIINAYAFCLKADIKDMISHGFSKATIKASFSSEDGKGTLSYDFFRKESSLSGNEKIINALKQETEESALLVWRHKTKKIPNFLYRQNRDITIALLEASRWKLTVDHILVKKKELDEKVQRLNSEINNLEFTYQASFVQHELKDIDEMIAILLGKREEIATKLKSSIALAKKDDFDADSIRLIVQSNKTELDKMRSKHNELKVKISEFNRLVHMAPADLYINDNLKTKVLHCPICDEHLSRESHLCPMCGTQKEIYLPDSVELMALQECALKERAEIKKETAIVESRIKELEYEYEAYLQILEENQLDKSTVSLETELDEIIIGIANLRVQKKGLVNKQESSKIKNEEMERKRAEREFLSERLQRYDEASSRVLSLAFDKESFKNELKEIWFDLWKRFFAEDYSKWDISVTPTLGVIIKAPDGKTYGGKDRNPGSEEDILSLTYQVAVLKTLISRGWSPTYRIFLMDDPFEGIDSETHPLIGQIIKEIYTELGFQVIITSRLFAADVLKETIPDGNYISIEEVTTPYSKPIKMTIDAFDGKPS